ncbi:hypothetical protein AMATHDRAFT_185316 [Amanita thiersii Skay4041]|uniref:Tubulin-tyrosine ligase n=1 Tax=Amanita thiersii Skay4041 TaxID=703135 RepID=A0A2A9P1Q5_9AGAR|nr:hypothetical protein AMATHDRAFT_185316 [Amanita thiersii Skay4041]
MLLCSVTWPTAPFTNTLVLKALSALSIPFSVVSSIPESIGDDTKLLQWSTYDLIDHQLTHLHRDRCLSSSYIIRKAIIRKHFLSHSIRSYVTKVPTSPLADACPKTYEIDVAFADELDELWADELWDLAEHLNEHRTWWILKPGMADRGMGIRLFNNQDTLRYIFEEFEEGDSDHESNDESITDRNGTAVLTSQLRHFVIQEYLTNPLLFGATESTYETQSSLGNLQGRKFHLRAYCVARGALEVYLYDRILALFSAVPFQMPDTEVSNTTSSIDLTPHLTNTSLQTHRGDEGVRLLEELIGCRILSSERKNNYVFFTESDVESIMNQMCSILREVFKAALQAPIHFQALPNVYELFGVDFLVVHNHMGLPNDPPYRVKLLELNAEPAIELTGPRLSWILEDLFYSIGKVCVGPFFGEEVIEGWTVGETKNHLIKCLEERIVGIS